METRRPPGLLRVLACALLGHRKPVIREIEMFRTCVIHHGYCPRCGADLEGRFELRPLDKEANTGVADVVPDP